MKLMSEGDWSFHLPSSLRTYVTEALPYELAALCFLLPCQAGKGIAGFGNWPHHSIDSEKRTDFVNLIKSLKTCSPNLRQRTSGQSWCGKTDLGLWSGVSSSRKFWKLNEFFAATHFIHQRLHHIVLENAWKLFSLQWASAERVTRINSTREKS